jgi:glucose-1-phosphate adenylyltransferase
MGGGRGTRLWPLTQERCKPAVPLAGKYRLVDIPISNCLNSGLNEIFVLTQFNTASLHRHIQYSYQFDPFSGGFVDILSAEQTESGEAWYQGTADAVRQNLMHFGDSEDDLFLILAGDQLYRMDFREMIRRHEESGAAVTVAATTVPPEKAFGLGLMRVDENLRIEEFVEKPTDPEVIGGLSVAPHLRDQLAPGSEGDICLASMGLYLFNGKILREALASPHADFGKELIPSLLGKGLLQAHPFTGYWEDIGTIDAFFEANLQLTDRVPPFNFFDEKNRVYSRARYLPAAKVNGATLERTVLADGCILSECRVRRSVIGVRSILREGSELDEVVMMGSDYFELNPEQGDHEGKIPLGVGPRTRVRHAIIDKNARIGADVVLDPTGLPEEYSRDGLYIRDGVLLVPKNCIVPDGYQLTA